MKSVKLLIIGLVLSALGILISASPGILIEQFGREHVFEHLGKNFIFFTSPLGLLVGLAGVVAILGATAKRKG